MDNIKRPLSIWIGITLFVCILSIGLWQSVGYSDAKPNEQTESVPTTLIIQYTDCATMQQVEIYDDGSPVN
jgi:hypothetical protein